MATPAQIGYNSVAISATADSEATGFDASSVLNSMTYEKWKPQVDIANLTIALTESGTTSVNYVAIGAHTMGTNGSGYTIQYSIDGVNFTTLVAKQSPTNDRARMDTFTALSISHIRIVLTDAIASIGSVYVGTYLEMSTEFMDDHDLGVYARKTEYKNNVSMSGQWLGRSIERQGLDTSFNWRYVTQTFYDASVEPFVQSAITNPFFIKWRPSDSPTEVLYCWLTQDVKPTISKVNNYTSFTLNVEAIE